ncbi:MOSC domain-containing protein [Microbacterium betulae]|uniref:MOSC domain-containing protein n=1 Tax=Microbacterium betulae TaxID=2981139 RepID=A0AA97I3I0_9MICO|nr:MOSC N-terminal beta barrel domain-containing protein [Microbacterium sp. AB]WOF21466.1 MOSC domain-containing protein [Microbacterium sp. AB]
MPRVSALYRHPVKGFTPEETRELTVQADGRVAGDRVLAFRFSDAAVPEDRDGLDHWPKSKGLSLMDFPSLARLKLDYDHDARRLRLSLDGAVVIEAGLDAAGRDELVAHVTEFLRGTTDGRRLERAGRLPLALVGDGERSRFQDRARGFVSLHASASVAAVDDAVPDGRIDDRRFRSNVVVDGVAAWAELGWRGRVRVGDVVFLVRGPIGRCLAVQANPDSGQRDAPVLKTLTRVFAQDEPTLGILLLPSGGGGRIRVGDEVEIVG